MYTTAFYTTAFYNIAKGIEINPFAGLKYVIITNSCEYTSNEAIRTLRNILHHEFKPELVKYGDLWQMGFPIKALDFTTMVRWNDNGCSGKMTIVGNVNIRSSWSIYFTIKGEVIELS